MAVSATSDGLPKLVESLSIAVEKKSDEVSAILDLITNRLVEIGSDCGDSAISVDQLATLLEWKSNETVAKAARLIAELSKCDAGREKCAVKQLTDILVNLLKTDKQDVSILTQVSRALGNICYENDVGRLLVLSADCLPPALRVVERSLSEPDEVGRRLRLVSAGLLLNLLIGQDEAQRTAHRLGAAHLLAAILEADGGAPEGEETANHVMLVFGLMADSCNGAQLLDERVCKATVAVLGASTSPELSEMCLELLHGQAEDETVKVHLAHSGVCELLFQLLEKHKPLVDDEDTRNLMKMACDLIVLILTGDASMNILYAEGKGKVFEEMVSWLCSDDEDLQITGVLAMGNFARTDKHCIQMVAAGVSKKLLALIEKNNTSAGDIRLQHALLSALRNLVIPVQNKPTVLANGLVDIVYPMLEIPTFPVVFKLLGTLRMVIDGQDGAARDLGRRGELIGRLVAWCATEDHPGVQGEASRLLAWLIKNSRDAEVVRTMSGLGAVQCLCTMVTAEHAVMQNEALVALALVAAMRQAECEARLLEAGVGSCLARLVDKHGASAMAREVILNVLTLVGQLIKTAELKQHLVESGLSTSLATLLARENIAEIHDQISTMRTEIDSV